MCTLFKKTNDYLCIMHKKVMAIDEINVQIILTCSIIGEEYVFRRVYHALHRNDQASAGRVLN